MDLLTYFNTNYVSGSFKKLQVPAAIRDDQVLLRMRKVPSLFSVDIWNVHDITFKGGHCINNSYKAWKNGFHQMIGHDHPSIWVAIENQAHVATQLLQAAKDQPPKKRGDILQWTFRTYFNSYAMSLVKVKRQLNNF